jgi:tetratricopeptide (TPR) repeat protein
MWRSATMLVLVLGMSGCMSEKQERVRTYNEDGLDLFQKGEYQQARDAFQAAATLTPEDSALYYNLGQCHERMGDPANAERYYNECLGRDLNNAECRHALAMLMLRQNRRDEAARMVQQWLAREPNRAAAYAEDGWLMFQSGDLPGAQARLQQALEFDPHDVRTLTELARVYEALNRPDRAIALYERVLEQNPKQFEVAKRIKALKSQGTDQPHPD